MKVVCIMNSNNFDGREFKTYLTIGKIYSIKYVYNCTCCPDESRRFAKCKIDGVCKNFYRIDLEGSPSHYHKSRFFITLEEHRTNQLNKILI